MPELPEVEVTRLSFADRIDGALVTGVQMADELRALVYQQIESGQWRGVRLAEMPAHETLQVEEALA